MALRVATLLAVVAVGVALHLGSSAPARAGGPEEHSSAQVLIGRRGAGGRLGQRRRNRGRQVIGEMRRSWHVPASHEATQVWSAIDPRPMNLVLVHGAAAGGARGPVMLTPDTAAGGWDAGDLQKAADALAAPGAGACPVAPRLLDVIYRATLEFRAPHVNVVGGCRGDDPSSRHAHGMAIDLALPGTDDSDLARFIATLGFVGIGYYPSAGFVHVDVRDASHYWVDRAEPGGQPDQEAVRERSAARTDRSATRYRGATPTEAPPGVTLRLEEVSEIEVVLGDLLDAPDEAGGEAGPGAITNPSPAIDPALGIRPAEPAPGSPR